MTEKNSVMKRNEREYSEKLKAACALNMCTVSVSQIIDYRDSYILEQEYDAILNNLNLKEIPKSEALLRIISELLNTITFFRIQKIKKEQIEKNYRRKIRNAIWAAIPNLSVIASGQPVAIAFSLATQIGSGYMNYRREKANAGVDREDKEVELQITAIEQLSALRQELFTTAWRLADEYEFPDEWRLTEKQIKQYDDILMDQNEYRKYARLEAISHKFMAYPPFWYFYGHTAHYIAEQARKRMSQNKSEAALNIRDLEIAKKYTELAKQHYEYYYSLTSANLLRENQMEAIFALEYIDLLWGEEKKDFDKIHELLRLAEAMAPTAFDILQLCAISYLKVGATDDAVRLFKILVNEGYNAISNAKFLSRLYVCQYLQSKEKTPYVNYKLLELQVDPLYLYPMPETRIDQTRINAQNLEHDFLLSQKLLLKKAYHRALIAFEKKQIMNFNKTLPLPQANSYFAEKCYGNTYLAKKYREEIIKTNFKSNKKGCVQQLAQCKFRAGYIHVLNETVSGIEKLSCFRKLDKHDELIYLIEAKIRLAKKDLMKFQEDMNQGSFKEEECLALINDYSYRYFTEKFFYNLMRKLFERFDCISNMKEVEYLNNDLASFCEDYNLFLPDGNIAFSKNMNEVKKTARKYYEPVFQIGLLGEEEEESDKENQKKEKCNIIQKNSYGLILNTDNAGLICWGSPEFSAYWQNEFLQMDNLAFESRYTISQSAFAILTDKTKKDVDLIFCVEGIAIVNGNIIQDVIPYQKIECQEVRYANGQADLELKIGYPDVYWNKNVDIAVLNRIVSEMKKASLY